MGFITNDHVISHDDDKTSLVSRVWCWLHHLPKRLVAKVVGIATMMRNLARDDPRRVIHSFKVGLAITLVSLFYYFQPLYNSFGVSAMWVVMTVVVVFEFTVGATLGKGLNRALATSLAGALGVGAHHLASLCGKIGEPVLIGLFVYIFAAASTFMRFFPKIKARYDYGFLISILTFSFVSISGYRADEIVELAHKRLSTIAIGGSVSLLINSLIFPVWAGEELHRSVATNMEKLGLFLEGFGTIYLKSSEGEVKSKDGNKTSFQGYKSVLNSKNVEDTMANFARWEPGHGRFRYHHPWNQYLKLGGLVRQCAYRIDALNAYFDPQTQKPQKFPEEIREACTKISLESSKTLKELGSSIRKMTYPSTSVNAHIVSSKAAVKSFKTFLKSGSSYNQNAELLQIIPIATLASLLIDIVDCTEKIAESTYDLAILAHFKKAKIKETNVVEKSKPENVTKHEAVTNNHVDCPQVVITIAELTLITSNSSAQGNYVDAKSDGQHTLDD
ncbi:aluminum-activated malate transporter 2-like [Chenopodium quinoa]|uniref:aluminum-activated malate transporter 2-like n=1 Tax=Chenopodium quinoa TaxID=63459 RepID=UPI000B77638B|nr:aluminum-activated malate transporter 2-like [Chenopodium quinoa]